MLYVKTLAAAPNSKALTILCASDVIILHPAQTVISVVFAFSSDIADELRFLYSYPTMASLPVCVFAANFVTAKQSAIN